ncbi:RNA polymerase II-associated factor 1 homolog [Cotesia typhae]|uniref:RNA polymerase II-associated factor 1 homolog n=1 Tax=Cotesia typhae TaxID=2053667 RepID=UPI003D68F990
MAPTIQINRALSDRVKRPGTQEKRSELLSRVKYCNTLPDLPFDVKFIKYPFNATRFVQYNPTTLESSHKHEILTEHDLGVEIDLINRDIYALDPCTELHPDDERLLEDEVFMPQDSVRSRYHAKNVSWLRRTEYISTEKTRFNPQTMDKVEAKVGFTLKKNFVSENLYKDRDSQIRAIDKTFEDTKKPIKKHYRKAGVVPVEILPVLPDFDMWKHPCAHVIFETEAAVKKTSPAEYEATSQAVLRGVKDENSQQFVAYFLPLEETMEKRRRDFAAGVEYEDDEEYKYKMAKEYNWNVIQKGANGNEDNYFLVMRNDGVYYNELDTLVRLRKRRQVPGQQQNNTLLVVKHRPVDASEHNMHRNRERQLEPPNDDDDEEEEEEEEEGQEQEEEQAEDQENGQNEGSQASSRASSRSKSRSRSRSKLRSRSKSQSRSRSRSKSQSRSKSRSKSQSRSRPHSPSKSRSRSHSRARSHSRSKSNSVSPAKSYKSRSATPQLRTPSPSPSSARSRSASRSPSRSRSRSRSAS